MDTCNRRNLGNVLIEHQLQTLGHWQRKEDSSIKIYALYTTNRGKNHRGRPRHIYVKLTQETTSLSIQKMKEKAMDHSEWRHVVKRIDPIAPG